MVKRFKDYITEKVNLTEESLFDSSSLYHEMAILRPGAREKMQNALQFISSNGIQGVVIGGMSVSHFTVDRHLTPDVDFLVADMGQLKAILDSQNIAYQPLASTGEFDGINVPEIDADFLDANQGNIPFNHYILKTAVPAKIGGATFAVINPAVLTILKFTLGREKDTEDAFKLLPTVPKKEIKSHLVTLKNWLGNDIDAETIWNYAQSLAA
ncbi:MAG: hypothetical protein DWQ19_09170 [Crenarchaeota archaeon]|nr:MAG: hypothetical protein DWQ19_09170 [Thermoproteota archaeon]